MKRFVGILLSMFIILSVLSVSVLAVNSEMVQPYYNRFSSIATDLTISAAVARYEGTANSDESTDNVYVTAYLQQKVNGSWITVSSASSSGKRRASAVGSCGVGSGYFYRVRVDAKTYNASGALLESVTEYSSQKYY